MQGEQRARTIFLWLWTLVTAAKLVVAARLPLFVDEAFYWQEGQHLAAAYSDLPGLTAWLARLGVEIGGHHVLALRLPFLAIGALLPLLVVSALLFDFGFQSALVAHQTLVYGLVPPARSRLNALLFTGMFIGMAAGGALGSLALAQWGWHGVAWLAVVCAGGSLLLRLK